MSKKLLFMIDKVESGGAENVLIKIMNNFYSKGNQVFFIPNLSIDNRYLDKVDECIVYIDTKIKITNRFTRIYSLIKYFFIIIFFVKKEKPDYIISFLERSNIINVLVSKITKTQCIISTRNNLSQQYSVKSKVIRYIIKFLIKYTYNKADKIISLSESVKYDLVINFGVNESLIKVLYNPYDLKKISFLSNQRLEENELALISNACITVGRLTEQKGHIFLIRAFSYVVNHISNAKLVIIGEGELMKVLKNEIEQLNLSNNVLLLGYCNNPFKYIRNAKLFLFSSLWEGFGNALLEAMICGKAVISTNCDSGPAEILCASKNSNNNFTLAKYGIITPVMKGDKEEEVIYAQAIIKLLSDDKLRNNYEKKSLERSSHFSNEKILRLWDEIILYDK